MERRITKVGVFNKKKLSILEPLLKRYNLSIKGNAAILVGDANIKHMKNSHPDDYKKYGQHLRDILKKPDYLGVHESKGKLSIEFIKEFVIDNEHVKVAVRVSNKGKYFARTMYVVSSNRVRNFLANGDLVEYK